MKIIQTKNNKIIQTKKNKIKYEYDLITKLIKDMLKVNNEETVNKELYIFLCGLREGLSRILDKEEL